MSSAPSLVLTKETSVHFASSPSYGDLLRENCHAEFNAALRVYRIMDGDDKYSRADALRGCRQNAWFARNSESGEVRVASSACSLRWCPVCNNARRNYVSHEIAEWLSSADHPKLMTLTLQHRDIPLDVQIQNLYSFFKQLRRRKDFKEAVSGGVWFFQVKRSKTDGLWHPHLHGLITGKYLPRRRLSRMWLETTSGSDVIDIRTIYEPRAVANDVARYATSPGSLVNLPPDDAIDLVDALHGRRICGTWGTARGISLRPKKETTPGKWISLGSWNTVVSLYDSDPDARAIVLSWKTGIILGEGISCNHIDDAINRMSSYDWEGMVPESPSSHERSPPEKLLF